MHGRLFLSVFAWALAPSLCLAGVGDVSITGGPVWPQGSFTRFADSGPVFSLRGTFHIPSAPGLIPWGDLSAVILSSDTQEFQSQVGTALVNGEETNTQWAGSLHVGLQIGSPTRRGFFRPRVAAGPGFYLFSRDKSLTLENASEPFYTKSISYGRMGWRGTAGADFYFKRKWGVALHFLYDQAWNVEDKKSARYQGFEVGVSLPTE